jgi:hypothetical protein
LDALVGGDPLGADLCGETAGSGGHPGHLSGVRVGEVGGPEEADAQGVLTGIGLQRIPLDLVTSQNPTAA